MSGIARFGIVAVPLTLVACAQGGTGGQATHTDSDRLTDAQRIVIGRYVSRCMKEHYPMESDPMVKIRLIATTDATGTVQKAEIVPPTNRAFAQLPSIETFEKSAVAAVLSPKCATLPLPASMLGQSQTFAFEFTP